MDKPRQRHPYSIPFRLRPQISRSAKEKLQQGMLISGVQAHGRRAENKRNITGIMERQAAHKLCRQILEKVLSRLIQGRKQAQGNTLKGEMALSLRGALRQCPRISAGYVRKTRD